MPDLLAALRELPRGSAFIYREALGAHDVELAKALRRESRERGVQFLIGADADLALAVGADGVHLPRGAAQPALPDDLLLTRSARKDGGPEGDVSRLDALFVSSVFSSRSPSAGTPIGVEALSNRARSHACPVYALGGVSALTAPALIGTGAAGLAAIGGLLQDLKRTAPMPVADNPPNKGQDTIEAEPKSNVSISKDEGGELITYTATVAGESATGELTLRRIADGVWNANHTGVPNEIGGRGVGLALVRAMSEDARAQGWTIRPGCPFVAALFERKPELATGIT